MGSNPTLLRGCQKYNIRPGSSGAVAGPNLFFDQPLIYSRENILLGLGRKTGCPTPGRIDDVSCKYGYCSTWETFIKFALDSVKISGQHSALLAGRCNVSPPVSSYRACLLI